MSDVLTVIEGTIGHITLNRPKAINALSLDMVRTIDAALVAWQDDDNVRIVLLDGAGERGFCAGGDIRSLYDSVRTGTDLAARFFRDEFRLNARIAEYDKPIVALMDGIVMGGGIGLAGHASHRIVTERATLAMPEVGIGYLPDVGSTYIMSTRSPGELGTHLALTGGRFGADDAIAANFADLFVPGERLGEIAFALRGCGDTGDVDEALAPLTAAPPAGSLRAAQAWIDACYAGDEIGTILERLDAHAPQAAAEIRTKSPTSVKQTLRVLRSARRLGDLRACLEQELRAATHCLRAPDFAEGIRAAVVDKDRNPRWSPSTLDAVTDDLLDRLFPADFPTLPALFAGDDASHTE